MDAIDFEIVRTRIRVRCADRVTFELFEAAYGHLAAPVEAPDLIFTVSEIESGHFSLQPEEEPAEAIEGRGLLLAYFDDAVVVALQLLHPDLYFLHAAVMAIDGSAFIFPAPAGCGKSTLTWALLQHGFEYLSDELAPLILDTLEVLPFPRPLCLKEEPPSGHEITTPTVTTEQAIHISPTHLPVYRSSRSLPVKAMFFPRYDPELPDSEPREVSAARAATRTYVNCLNALAHPASGLEGAASIATRLPCFELLTADLDQACRGVCQIVDDLIRHDAKVISTR